MRCLEGGCKYYSADQSKYYERNFCTISMSCVTSGCPVDSMIRFCEDRLAGLVAIKKYLAGLQGQEQGEAVKQG